MTSNIIQVDFRRTFDPVRVELSSPGAQGGRPFYLVDFVEADGSRAGMWEGTDLAEAREAAAECADGKMPVVELFDRTGGAA